MKQTQPHNPPDRPMLPRSRLLMAVRHSLDRELGLVRDYGLGVEVQTFANPAMLARDYSSQLRGMVKRLSRIKGIKGCHGPFIDTVHFSLDREIMAVSYRRYIEALEIAEAIGASFVVLHSQYNSCIRIPTYDDIYHHESLRFWPKLLAEAERRRITVYLENMFDNSPWPMRRLADAINSPTLKLCLDVAHAVVHSTLALETWVEAMGPHLRHIHLSDSYGDYDDHIALGAGRVEFSRFFAITKPMRAALTYTLETGSHTRKSLRYLGIASKNKINSS